MPRIEGRIDLDGVTFAYGAEPVLHALDVHVPAGGCLALVGESGGGKSTTAKLIARFYDPADGVVRVDGHDLREVDLASYRRQLGVVLQDPFLFSGTIADNIRFARPEATDAEVEEVARAIGVDAVAARLDGGLQHVVREGGSGLSAGERQLISIARALLADPRILILDEATSNIDRPTERLIEGALDRLLRGRTSLIIAHRLSTVRRADEILVLDHGRVVERGTYDRLMATEGPFRRLAAELTGTVPGSMSDFHSLLNEQIGHEFSAAQQYIAIAVWYDQQTLPRLAAHFYQQALEERNHAMMIVQYLMDTDRKVMVPGAEAPRNEFASISEPVAVALEQEKRVTAQINAITAAARAEQRLPGRAVHAVVPEGAGRGGRLDVRPAARLRARARQRAADRGLPGARDGSRDRRPDGARRSRRRGLNPAPGYSRRISS